MLNVILVDIAKDLIQEMALYLASFPRRETQVQKDSDLDAALA